MLKKYSPIGELSEFAGEYAESMAQILGELVCITDKDHVVAAAGTGRKDLDGKPISKQLETMIEERQNFLTKSGEWEPVKVILDDPMEYTSQAAAVIISEGDAIGAVVLCSKNHKTEMGETEAKLAKVAADFLGRQMEQ